MTIVAVEPIVVALPFPDGMPPTGLGSHAWATLNYLLVKVTDSDGLVGYGEGFGYGAIPATRAALDNAVAPLLLGTDGNPMATHVQLSQALHLYGRSGPMAFAVAAVDIALWDLAGKRAGKPLYELLGAGRREHVDAYASALHLGVPEQVATQASRVVARGLRGLKLHETDADCVRAARDIAGTELSLMLDVNCAWSAEQAQARLAELMDLALSWIEEPVWPPEDTQALGRVANTTAIPVAAGENATTAAEAHSLTTVGGCAYLQPSVTKVGISGFRIMAEIALTNGASLAPHSPYLGPGLLATLQLAAVYSGINWIEHLWAHPEANLYADTFAQPDAEGRYLIPSGPGLGADPDPLVVSKYRLA